MIRNSSKASADIQERRLSAEIAPVEGVTHETFICSCTQHSISGPRAGIDFWCLVAASAYSDRRTGLTADQAQLLATMRLHASAAAQYENRQTKVAEFSDWIRNPGTTVTLNFSNFFDVIPDAIGQKVQLYRRGPDDFSWVGKGATIFDDVVFTVKREAVIGVIWISTQHAKLQILPLGGGAHALMLVRVPPLAAGKAAANGGVRAPAGESMRCGMGARNTRSGYTTEVAPALVPTLAIRDSSLGKRNDCSEITLMGVYTSQASQQARESWGTDLPQWIQHHVDVANVAYRNSGIYTTLKLVYTYQTDYVDSDPYMDGFVELYRLIDPSDGYLDEVHPERQAHMADVVVLYTKDNAWYDGVAQGIGNGAFVHLKVNQYFLHQFLLAHEIAHLQGLWDVGICDATDQWRTVMDGDYDPDCAPHSLVVPYFANPLLSRDGVTLGDFSSPFEAATINSTACRLSSSEGQPAAITSLVGDKDHFGNPDLPTRSAGVQELTLFETRGHGIGAFLDEMGSDRPVGFSAFYEPSAYPTSAKLRIRIRSWDPLVYNDAISIAGVTSSPSEQDPACQLDPDGCTHDPLFPVVAIRDLLGREPAYNETYDVVLNFARVPLRTRDTTGGPGGHWSAKPDEYRNLLGNLVGKGDVGVVVGDDTGVDYAELTVTSAAPDSGKPIADMNGDGIVDQTDVNIILEGLRTKAYSVPGASILDPRDLDGDGWITLNDARICASACTYQGCRSKP